MNSDTKLNLDYIRFTTKVKGSENGNLNIFMFMTNVQTPPADEDCVIRSRALEQACGWDCFVKPLFKRTDGTFKVSLSFFVADKLVFF